MGQNNNPRKGPISMGEMSLSQRRQFIFAGTVLVLLYLLKKPWSKGMIDLIKETNPFKETMLPMCEYLQTLWECFVVTWMTNTSLTPISFSWMSACPGGALTGRRPEGYHCSDACERACMSPPCRAGWPLLLSPEQHHTHSFTGIKERNGEGPLPGATLS